MAIDLSVAYPTKVNPPSPAWPFGQPRNIIVPGDGTGTPWEQSIIRDTEGFKQALLTRAMFTPSGVPDTAEVSQYLQAIYAMCGQVVDTIDDMVSLDNVPDMSLVRTNVYRTGGSKYGGGLYRYRSSVVGVADAFLYHSQNPLKGSGQYELIEVLPNLYQAGAYGDKTADDTVYVQAYANAKLGFLYAPEGSYRCTATITFPVATTVFGRNKAGNAYNSTSEIQTYFLHDFDGDFFVFDGSGGVVQGAGGGLDSVSLVQVFGTTGTGYGKAVVVKGSTTSLRANWFRIDNVNIETDSGNSKGQWSWNIDIDGSAPGGTDGVRDIYLDNLRIVGGAGATGGMRLWCAKNVFMSNVQTNLTNSHILVSGPSAADVTAAVYASNCVASWQLDHASGVNIIGGRIDTISSTANTSSCYVAPASINVVPTTLPGCTLTAMSGGGWFAKKDDANPARVCRDVGYGDSTNSVQFIVGNQGTGEGGAIAQYRNGDPQQAIFGLYGRNVADTSVAAMARIEMTQISGQDYAQMDFYTGTERKLRFYQQGSANADVSASWRPTTDNTYTLGISGLRWSVVYAATGTINTSDERSKQDIDKLSDAEKRVAAKAKALVRKFRFKDAVAKKGDSARIHFGVIAQELIAAFESEGLDPMHYGVICYDEWDEQQEVIENRPDEFSENGELLIKGGPVVVQDYRPAGSAYGVRYDELACFIMGAL